MPSIHFRGAKDGVVYNGVSYNHCWHKGPTMQAEGTLEGFRLDNTITINITASSIVKSTYYNYDVGIILYQDGREIKRWSVSGGNFSDVVFTHSVTTNKATTFSVNYACGQPGGCTTTTYGLTNNSISFEAYNPSVAPTNVQRGTIYSTNNSSYDQQTSRNISDKPDLKVWFNWWRTIKWLSYRK